MQSRLNFKNSVNQTEYNRFSKNGSVDIISQESIHKIPKNRLVMMNGVPHDSHSLHNFFRSQRSPKHPIYPSRNVPSNVVKAIERKAKRTGWSDAPRASNNRTVPASARQYAANQSRAREEQLRRQMMRQVSNILGPNASMSSKERIMKLADQIRPRLNTNRNIHVQSLGLRLVVGNHDTTVTWSSPSSNNRNVVDIKARPYFHIDGALVPMTSVPPNLLQAEWLVEDRPGTTPGSRTQVTLMTRALLTAIGFLVINPSSNAARIRRGEQLLDQVMEPHYRSIYTAANEILRQTSLRLEAGLRGMHRYYMNKPLSEVEPSRTIGALTAVYESIPPVEGGQEALALHYLENEHFLPTTTLKVNRVIVGAYGFRGVSETVFRGRYLISEGEAVPRYADEYIEEFVNMIHSLVRRRRLPLEFQNIHFSFVTDVLGRPVEFNGLLSIDRSFITASVQSFHPLRNPNAYHGNGLVQQNVRE